eukprot:1844781-Ditylum_brightwellii.AAC.2
MPEDKSAEQILCPLTDNTLLQHQVISYAKKLSQLHEEVELEARKSNAMKESRRRKVRQRRKAAVLEEERRLSLKNRLARFFQARLRGAQGRQRAQKELLCQASNHMLL